MRKTLEKLLKTDFVIDVEFNGIGKELEARVFIDPDYTDRTRGGEVLEFYVTDLLQHVRHVGKVNTFLNDKLDNYNYQEHNAGLAYDAWKDSREV